MKALHLSFSRFCWVCLIVSFCNTLQAQRDYYVKLFDLVHQKNGVTGTGPSPNRYWQLFAQHRTQSSAHTQSGLEYGENWSYLIEAYAVMGTNVDVPNHKEYLKYTLTMMSHIFSERDDHLSITDGYTTTNAPNGSCPPVPAPSSSGRSEKWWCGTYHNSTNNTATYGHPGKSGHTLYPALIWIKGVLSNPTLQSLLYTEDPDPAYQNIYTGVWHGLSYYDIAFLLLNEVEETLAAHELYQWKAWNGPTGIEYGTFFNEHWTFPGFSDYIDPQDPCAIANASTWSEIHEIFKMPLNYNAAIGRCYVLCWNIYDMTGIDPNKTAHYLNMSQRLANYTRWHIRDYGLHPDGGYVWYYSDPVFDGATNRSIYPEDYAHQHVSVEFPYLCYDLGLPYSAMVNVFDDTDMIRIAKSITRAFEKNRAFWSHSNGDTGIPTYAGTSLVQTDPNALNRYADFSEYAQFQPDIYHQGLDAACDKYLQATPMFTQPGYSHSYTFVQFKTLAHNIRNHSQDYAQPSNLFRFRLVGTKRGWGVGSKWIGMAGGDLDGDGLDNEMGCLRNYTDRKISLQSFNENLQADYGTSPLDPNYRNMEPTFLMSDPWTANCYTYAGIAFGDLNPSSAGDEVVIARNNCDGSFEHFFLFNSDGQSMTQLASYTGYGNGSQWVGVCTGNFDGAAGDEMASIRTSDGSIAMLQYNGTTLVGVPGGSPITGITNCKTITAGNINGDGQSEIVVVNNDGSIEIFKYLMGSLIPSSSITPTGSYLSGGESLLAAQLGDYDGDLKQNELVLLASSGMFYVLRINPSSISSTSHSWNTALLHTEKFNSDFFANGACLGTLPRVFDYTDCTFDYLLVARNSSADGNLMTMDLGLDLSIYQCGIFAYESGSSTDSKKWSRQDQESTTEKFGQWIYPNPATSKFFIQPLGEHPIVDVNIYSVSGRLMAQHTYRSDGLGIDISDLPSGIYFVVLTNVYGNTTYEKLVKP